MSVIPVYLHPPPISGAHNATTKSWDGFRKFRPGRRLGRCKFPPGKSGGFSRRHAIARRTCAERNKSLKQLQLKNCTTEVYQKSEDRLECQKRIEQENIIPLCAIKMSFLSAKGHAETRELLKACEKVHLEWWQNMGFSAQNCPPPKFAIEFHALICFVTESDGQTRLRYHGLPICQVFQAQRKINH